MSLREVLEAELRRFEIDLPSEKITTLARYCDELVRWNKKINLTGLHGDELVRRLVVEPAWVAVQLKFAGIVADIGSGNGSPAIPIHVVSQVEATHMIEARAKRAAFLRHVVSFLGLNGMVVHRARLEEIGPVLRNVDWITLQGVALTAELFEAFRPIASPTTKVVWITSEATPSVVPSQRLKIPFTNSEVLIFQLDLS